MTTHMRREIDEIPAAVARLAAPERRDALRAVAARLAALDPPALLTVARGSSDHAATYLSHAAGMALGLPVASFPPSLVTVHEAPLRARGLAALAISQSGKSGDLVATAGALERAGCPVVALTNTPGSPLARAASEVIDIAAGPERAVAATKSFVASIVAGLWVIAFWSGDRTLEGALRALPEALDRPDSGRGATEAVVALAEARSAVVIGRGPGLGLAHEVALKLIETCALPAAAYSAAEVLHGPSAILTAGHPVLALVSRPVAATAQAVERLSAQGARVLTVGDGSAAESMDGGATGHALVDPLLAMPALYRAIEARARGLGLSPDRPPNLTKETRTL